MSAPALTCAGCGTDGRRSTIDRSAAEAQLPLLQVVLGWGDEGRSALLCPRCRALFHKPRRRRRKASSGALL